MPIECGSNLQEDILIIRFKVNLTEEWASSIKNMAIMPPPTNGYLLGGTIEFGDKYECVGLPNNFVNDDLMNSIFRMETDYQTTNNLDEYLTLVAEDLNNSTLHNDVSASTSQFATYLGNGEFELNLSQQYLTNIMFPNTDVCSSEFVYPVYIVGCGNTGEYQTSDISINLSNYESLCCYRAQPDPEPETSSQSNFPLNENAPFCCNVSTIVFTDKQIDCNEPDNTKTTVDNIRILEENNDNTFQLSPITGRGRILADLTSGVCCTDTPEIKILPTIGTIENDRCAEIGEGNSKTIIDVNLNSNFSVNAFETYYQSTTTTQNNNVFFKYSGIGISLNDTNEGQSIPYTLVLDRNRFSNTTETQREIVNEYMNAISSWFETNLSSVNSFSYIETPDDPQRAGRIEIIGQVVPSSYARECDYGKFLAVSSMNQPSSGNPAFVDGEQYKPFNQKIDLTHTNPNDNLTVNAAGFDYANDPAGRYRFDYNDSKIPFYFNFISVECCDSLQSSDQLPNKIYCDDGCNGDVKYLKQEIEFDLSNPGIKWNDAVGTLWGLLFSPCDDGISEYLDTTLENQAVVDNNFLLAFAHPSTIRIPNHSLDIVLSGGRNGYVGVVENEINKYLDNLKTNNQNKDFGCVFRDGDKLTIYWNIESFTNFQDSTLNINDSADTLTTYNWDLCNCKPMAKYYNIYTFSNETPSEVPTIKHSFGCCAEIDMLWDEAVTEYTDETSGQKLIILNSNVTGNNEIEIEFSYEFGKDSSGLDIWNKSEFSIITKQGDCVNASTSFVNLENDCATIPESLFEITPVSNCVGLDDCTGEGIKFEWPNNMGNVNYTITANVPSTQQSYVIKEDFNPSGSKVVFYSSRNIQNILGSETVFTLSYTCSSTNKRIALELDPEPVCITPTNVRIEEDAPEDWYLKWDGPSTIILEELVNSSIYPSPINPNNNRHRVRQNNNSEYEDLYEFILKNTNQSCSESTTATFTNNDFGGENDITCGQDLNSLIVNQNIFPHTVRMDFDSNSASNIVEINWYITETEMNPASITLGSSISYGNLTRTNGGLPTAHVGLPNRLEFEMDCTYSTSRDNLKEKGIDRYCNRTIPDGAYLYFEVICEQFDANDQPFRNTTYHGPEELNPITPSQPIFETQVEVTRECRVAARTLRINLTTFTDIDYALTLGGSSPNATTNRLIALPLRNTLDDPNSPLNNPLELNEFDLSDLGFTSAEIDLVFNNTGALGGLVLDIYKYSSLTINTTTNATEFSPDGRKGSIYAPQGPVSCPPI